VRDTESLVSMPVPTALPKVESWDKVMPSGAVEKLRSRVQPKGRPLYAGLLRALVQESRAQLWGSWQAHRTRRVHQVWMVVEGNCVVVDPQN
jgi:hypothetical protein